MTPSLLPTTKAGFLMLIAQIAYDATRTLGHANGEFSKYASWDELNEGFQAEIAHSMNHLLENPQLTEQEIEAKNPSKDECALLKTRINLAIIGAFRETMKQFEPAPAPIEILQPDIDPFAVDQYGFAPTKVVSARWSKNGGRVKFFRIWRKPENLSFCQERELSGEEYAVALEHFAKQKLIEKLAKEICADPFKHHVTIGGHSWGFILTAAVHFAGIVSLRKIESGYEDVELEPPTDEELVNCIAAIETRNTQAMEAKAAGRTEADLEAENTALANDLGLSIPEAEQPGIIPITLENMQAEGLGLDDRKLR